MKNNEYIERIIISCISRGYHELVDIATNCGGIYLSELLPILDRLVCSDLIFLNERGQYLIKKCTCPQIILPEPHPLDFDWRFDSTSSKMIMELLIRENLYSDTILLLGSPSIFIEFTKLCYPPKVKLIDWNKELIDYINKYDFHKNLSCINLDLFDIHKMDNDFNNYITDNHSVNIVFFDSPWYIIDYKIFLVHASNFINIGGMVILSLMSFNARPNAYVDRDEIIDTAKLLGFHIESLINNAITYQNPAFELKSLENENISVSKNWRKSDLLVLRKISKSTKDIDIIGSLEIKRNEDEKWLSFLFDIYKIKIKFDRLDIEDEPEIISIEKNDILPTVSRRYEKRSLVDL